MNNINQDDLVQFKEVLLGKSKQPEVEEACRLILTAVEDWKPSLDKATDNYVHQLLYIINTSYLALPWEHPNMAANHPAVSLVKYTLEKRWNRQYLSQIDYDALPNDVSSLMTFFETYVQQHASNVEHPIFDFLHTEANKSQLKEFIRQETPFDIHFGDLINQMMLGVYGSFKEEIAANFWDEVGHGRHEDTHRTLRLNLMEHVGLSATDHLQHIDSYLTSELMLANMYFEAVFDRSQLVQMIGMMMATELMVPGRLQKQIAGWQRVGLANEPLRYLIEHTVVDVEHAKGWVNNVVIPLVEKHPDTKRLLWVGIQRRMNGALAVCDEALTYLQTKNLFSWTTTENETVFKETT